MPVILPPSRTEMYVRTLTYFLLGCAGLWVLLDPPTTIQGQIGWLTYLWGTCLMFAFISAYGGFRKRYRIEYMALPLSLTGVLVYAYTLWVIVPETTTRGPQALIITAVSTMILLRLLTLHRIVISWKEKPWIGSQQSSRD